jgi:murein DD-endopeptidase MepM/ murein hydrolase activator NlpD
LLDKAVSALLSSHAVEPKGRSVADDKLTLIVMHSPRQAPRSFSISRRLVMLAACVVVAFLAFAVFSGIRTFAYSVRSDKLRDLENENRALREEIARLTDKVSEFESQMAEHVEFEERLRIMADLEPMDAGVWGVGVGGPELVVGASVSGPVGGTLSGVNEDIDRLLRQLELQSHSFTEILKRLKGKKDELARIPSIRPVDVGYISSYFGKRPDPFTGRICIHEGLDFSARRGSKIYATADGTVCRAKYDRGYGYTVEIDHGNGIKTKYAHNDKILVKNGQKVKRGDVIAYLGNSGRSTAPHLHYEVVVNGIPQNPLNSILPSDVVVD